MTTNQVTAWCSVPYYTTFEVDAPNIQKALEKAKLQAPDQFGELCVSEFHWDEFEIDSKGDADDYVRHLEPALRVAIAAPELLDVCTILAEDCRMALSGE